MELWPTLPLHSSWHYSDRTILGHTWNNNWLANHVEVLLYHECNNGRAQLSIDNIRPVGIQLISCVCRCSAYAHIE